MPYHEALNLWAAKKLGAAAIGYDSVTSVEFHPFTTDELARGYSDYTVPLELRVAIAYSVGGSKSEHSFEAGFHETMQELINH